MKKSVIVVAVFLASLLGACSGSDGGSDAPTSPAPTIPPPTPTLEITVTKDVVYATPLVEGDPDWTLDVYAPAENGDWPTVILLHGLGANKEGYVRESEIISDNGAVVYTISWPIKTGDAAALENGRGYRALWETGTCAIRYARATSTDYGGDPGRLILVAHSWGALYGAWIALASDDLDTQWEEFRTDSDGPPAQVECVRDSGSAHVDAFIGVGGGRYTTIENLKDRNPELWEIVSPFSYLGQNTELSIILLHGTQDPIANPESSQMFNDVLVEAGYDSRVELFDGRHIVPSQLTFDAVMELASK